MGYESICPKFRRGSQTGNRNHDSDEYDAVLLDKDLNMTVPVCGPMQ